MTNYQKWKSLTSALESPDLFLDFAWWFAVNTSLERRVHYGDPARPQYLNLYILFVGPPAVGKGSAMREADRLLSAYPFQDPKGNFRKDVVTGETEALFPKLPDTTTFESLCEVLARANPKTIIIDEKTAKSYVAYRFQLEELSSLLRRNKADDVARFLLNLYDGEPYTYKTKHHGTFIIKNCSLAFIAGTQVDFIRRAESDGLLGEGLFSRFLVVYETQKRHSLFDYPELTDEQKGYKKDLQLWLRGLSKLTGRIILEPPVAAFLQAWYEKEDTYMERFADSKLALYFARRKDQVKRLAAAIHFSESADLTIPLPAFEQAIDIMRRLENSVIKLTRSTGRNPLFNISEQLLAYLRLGPKTNPEVMNFLMSDMELPEALNMLQMLQQSNRIELTKENLWTVKEKSS